MINQSIITCTGLKSASQEGLLFGYGSIFHNVDHQGDVVLPGAFSKHLQRLEREGRNIKMLWQHKAAEPIGSWYFMEEDSAGLYVEGQLLLDIRRAQEAYSLVKSGAIDGFSIGYRVIQSNRDKKTGVRYLSEVELLEISVVTFAANPKAKITGVKYQ